jgi:hypothetical protein
MVRLWNTFWLAPHHGKEKLAYTKHSSKSFETLALERILFNFAVKVGRIALYFYC